MPSWITEFARFDRLLVGNSYSKREAADAMGVSIPEGSRDWGGLVRFSNGVALFVTLEKAADRYAAQHQYNDRLDGDLLYWDSRASHDKGASQVKALRTPGIETVSFARVSEREEGRTQAFSYLGPLEFVDWWGTRPVHFTWRLRAFPEGLNGTPELTRLGQWRPQVTPQGRAQSETQKRATTYERVFASAASLAIEGAKGRVVANRYERDPRAREECLRSLGTMCFVCGFDFRAVYGDLGAGFVFVHHRVPISVRARKGEYEVDPVRDLVPICGNCHAMVHRRQTSEDSSRGPSGTLSEEAIARLAELRGLASDDEWDRVE